MARFKVVEIVKHVYFVDAENESEAKDKVVDITDFNRADESTVIERLAEKIVKA